MNESQEMYLVHIARESEISNKPIPLRSLADHLNILPASVNQMIRKMEADGNVVYQPYKGVSLTKEGERQALRIIRNRRLWEVFLTDHLKFNYHQANNIACEFEHVTPDEVTDRLAAFLKHPQTTAMGKSIPGPEGEETVHLGSPLNLVTAGEQVQVKNIQSAGTQRGFLIQSGIAPGKTIKVLAMKADGVCLLHPQDAPLVQLDSQLTHQIRVIPIKENEQTPQD